MGRAHAGRSNQKNCKYHNRISMDFTITDNSALFKAAKDEAVARALEAIGLQAEGYAKMLAPVDTGRLRNSLTHTVEGNAAYIGTNVEYAPYQEYGTRRTKAQPFLKPAVQDHIDEYRAIAENELRKG